MDLYSFAPIATVIDVAYSVLMALAAVLDPLFGAASAAAAVVLVTLVVRAVLIPVGVSQARAEQMRARLAPRLADLQRAHGTNPERLQRETMALYREEGTTPFAGCLPMLAQAPVVAIIYAVFLLPTINGHPNLLLEQTLFGVPLGSSLAGSIVSGAAEPVAFAVFGVVIVLIAAVGEATRRLSRPGGPIGPRPLPVRAPGDSSAAPGGRADAAPGVPAIDPAKLAPMLGVLQFVTAVIAIFVPLAAGLYLVVTVAWTLGQRVVLRRRFPLAAPTSGV